MRLIDEDALMRCLTTIERLARSDAQKALLGRVFYIVSRAPVVSAPPYLLTLEEALSADECWMEGRNGACGYGDALLTDDAERVEFFRPHTISTLDFYAYGKDWRCWSYRPTDEQRKAVSWE